MFTFSATQALLPLEQYLTVLLQKVHCASIHVIPGESTKLCFYNVYLRTCAMELQNSSFSNPTSTLPPLHNRPHYYQQPSIWPCVSAPHFFVSVCAPAVCAVTLLCRELWEKIFNKSHALRGMEPSKNKWMACFSDLRTMKSPSFALSLT